MNLNIVKPVRLLILLLAPSLTTGCITMYYSRFQRFDDEFRNTTKLIARVNLSPVEKRTEVNSAYVVFEREISSANNKTNAYFVVSRSTKSFRIEDKGYLKAGARSFEISISNIISEYKSKSNATFQTFAGADSTGSSAGVLADMDERIWIDDKFKLSLTPDMISEIKNAGEFFTRFYFGPVPATFRFKGSKFKSVKKLLAE